MKSILDLLLVLIEDDLLGVRTSGCMVAKGPARGSGCNPVQ